MRKLINYIREMFCKHSFKLEESRHSIVDHRGDLVRRGVKVSATCTTCGYHKSYWKFL